ncbi:AraC family transcriptional regulator, partial [Salmonella enterica]|nr:AraC family transcriptional regulator [Salmonella enterica]
MARSGILCSYSRSSGMRICSNEPCIVLLTEKDTWLR